MAVDKNKVAGEICTLQFYRIVLGWDYLRLLKESQDIEKGKKNKRADALKSVKNEYADVYDYLSTFEPLLFEEVKAQIIKGRDEEDVSEWKIGMVTECIEADGFHMLGVLGEDWLSISQNDLLLLSKKKFEGGVDVPTAYAFALVEHRQKENLRLRMHLCGEIKGVNTDDVEVSVRLSNVRSLVTELQKTWSITKICNLSTIVREYIALRSISSLPFKDLILKASDSKQNSDDQAWKISKSLTNYIASNHNPSQLEAIRAGLSRKPFVLIQGPPGTGKTQTILGLLSAILHATPARMHSKGKLSEVKRGPELPIEAKYNHWGKASPWLMGINPRDAKMPENGDDGFFPTSGNDLKPELVNSSRKYRVRVLVCAPSNSALDEIVLRVLKTGLQDENNRSYNPKIVRIGLKAHHSVLTVSMDHLVSQKLAVQGVNNKQGGGGGDKTDTDVIRASVIDEAAIVFSTLSFSGTIVGKISRGFDVVVIDEAAQAVEAATLVPLTTGCKQVFLVGDPVQLPATVISSVADKLGYGMSLFKRFQQAGYPVQMLKTQYRMHPEIRSFPSNQFYEGALEDGPDVKEQTKREWHKYSCFGPFCFFDIHEGQQSRPPSGHSSWENIDEADFVLILYLKLIMKYPQLKSSLSSSPSVAIITPYRSQVKLFNDKFRDTFGEEYKKVIDINTIDGFQGREKDVAIFSCVRANKENSLGFVGDFRRMNVGITRAKASVLVVGSASTLRNSNKKEEHNHWKDLIESAEKRNCLVKVSKPYADFFSDENLKTMEVEMEGRDDEMQEMPDDDVKMSNMDANVDQDPVEEPDWGDGDGYGGDDD